MTAEADAPPGPPAGVWGSSRLGRRVSTHLMRALPLPLFGRIFPRRAIGLCYHVVSDRSLPHVRNLYRYKSPAQFEADLVYLARTFRVVGYSELEAGPPDPNAVVITFDDGLAECFDVVRPLLLKHGLPCIFFVSPPHLDHARMYPFDRASLTIEALRGMDGAARRAALLDISTVAGRAFGDLPGLARWLTSWMRTMDAEGEETLDRLCDIAGVDREAYLREHRPYLTSEQVRTLAADGFDIGAHGLRHVALGAFSHDEVRAEIVDSIAGVQTLTGADRIPFAFPYDGDGVDRDLLDRLRREDSRIGLLFNTGPMQPDREFMLNRMIVDGPALVGATRSNLAGYLRGMYLEEMLRLARGEVTLARSERPRLGVRR